MKLWLYILIAIPGFALAESGTEFSTASRDERVLKCKNDNPVNNGLLNPFKWCPRINLFDPSARIYFDTGSDDTDEVDIFDDGSLNATIDFASIYFPFELFESAQEFTFGPNIGIGISGPAQDAEDGSMQASSAPVFLTTVGLSFNYEIGDTENVLSFEVGKAFGYSTDESFGDNKDSANYVGFKLKFDL